MAPDSTGGAEVQLEVHGLAGQQHESCPLPGDDNSVGFSIVVMAGGPSGDSRSDGYKDASDCGRDFRVDCCEALVDEEIPANGSRTVRNSGTLYWNTGPSEILWGWGAVGGFQGLTEGSG